MLRAIFTTLIVFVCVHSFSQSNDRSNGGIKNELTPRTEGDISSFDFSINNIALIKTKFPELQGNGITLCLKENSPDFNDLDIGKHLKSSAFQSSIVSNHATALATLLVGNGITSPQNEGIAKAAKLICADFKNLMPESNDFYKEQNISIVNHSYGTTIENFYGAGARAYDVSVENRPQLLHVFSSGNLGYASGTDFYSGIVGMANLTGNFKQSKNSITVGALNSEGAPWPWSSAGPAYDGRLKPEVCAFSDEGTSGSAAMVSGVAALLQEYYFKNNTTYPDAALLKAVLINSATDVGKPGIDWQTGYGNINAYKAIKTLEANHIIKGVLKYGEDVTIPLSVPANSRNLKVTLTWTDPATDVNSSLALVNDLDLEIIGSDRWLPWVLNHNPKSDSLQKLATRGDDHLNTTEQVTIENPNEESYAVHISASRLKKQQTFYIAYQWDYANYFSWTSPVENNKLINNKIVFLRWESTLNTSKGNLEITFDDGQSWELLQADVLLSQGMLPWSCPNIFSKARFRMNVGDQTFVSDEFIISPMTTLSMSYHCSDSLELQWNTEEENKSVRAYQFMHYSESNGLWENYQQPSEDTTLYDTDETDVFAVLPITQNGVEGIRSESLIIKDQNIFCYYKNVTATVINDSIQIQCELSTTKNVSRVTFQKLKNDNTTSTLKTSTVIAGESYYTWSDNNLINGDNTYRIQIKLATGKTVYSGFIDVAYLKEKNFVIYPNPVDNHAFITILSKNTEAFVFTLFDYTGNIVLEQKFYEQQIDLPVINFKSGMYVYKIHSGTHQSYTGKIVLR